MNAEQLMEAMGELDASLVADTFEPAAPVKKRPARFWLRFAAAAAVFALVAGGVWAAVSRLSSQKSGSIPALPSETQPTAAPFAEATAAAPAVTEFADAAPTEAPSAEAAPTEAEPAATASTTASSSITAASPETVTTAAVTSASTKAAVPAVTVAPPAPATEAPTAQTEASWWERMFSGTGAVAGEREDSLLQRIAGLFSGGAPNGAGENGNETAASEAEPPAVSYHAFYLDFAELQNRAAAYRSMPVTEKTQAELEEIYGGPFLPTVFPDAAAPPQESSGAIHGVRTLQLGDTVACNEYLYVWTTPVGGSRSLAVTVDDGSYFPSGTIEDVCRVYQVGSATVYWLADTRGGEQRHLAIAKRGKTVVFTFILTGDCSDEDFLRTVTSALGC